MADTGSTDELKAPPKPRRRSERMLRAAVWTTFGRGLILALSLVSSLVMTRLLVPEIYGLMELVWAIRAGLMMFSDIGLTPNVVQSQHGEKERFLNAVWTLQILRSSILLLVALALAYPIAQFMGEPELTELIPAIGLSTLIEGFTSASLHVEQRRLNLYRVVRLQLVRHVMALVAQIAFALVWPTVWAFVVGSWVGTATYVISSRFLLTPMKHQLVWDKEYMRELFGFGKWIFAATALTFVATQSDRFMISKFVGDMAVLGLYGVAMRLSSVLSGLTGQLVRTVMLPALAEKRRHLSPDANVSESMSRAYYRAKLVSDAAILIPAGVFCAMSSTVVGVLYSSDYQGAGPILQILLFGTLFQLIAAQPGALLTAMGRAQHHLWQALVRALYTVIMLPVGYHFYGFAGLVWARSLMNLAGAPIYWAEMRVFGLFRPLLELPALAFFAVGFGLGSLVDPWLKAIL